MSCARQIIVSATTQRLMRFTLRLCVRCLFLKEAGASKAAFPIWRLGTSERPCSADLCLPQTKNHTVSCVFALSCGSRARTRCALASLPCVVCIGNRPDRLLRLKMGQADGEGLQASRLGLHLHHLLLQIGNFPSLHLVSRLL